jgi:exodeoxyribonuclease-5
MNAVTPPFVGGQVRLTPEQEQAAEAIDAFIDLRMGQSFVLHGLAGVGKSVLLAEIGRRHPHARVCCPTGKAAAVLRDRFELPARTIHETFYRLKAETTAPSGRRELAFEPRYRDGSHHNVVLLLDEASMVTAEMRGQLERLGVIIVAFGDPGQLPPVKGEPGFSEADVTLTEIHRQAQNSPIIRQAHRVRGGRDYQPDGDAFRVLPKGTADAVCGADIVLCHRNETRRFLNQYCRRARGKVRTSPLPDGTFDPVTAHPRAGEPVVVLRNNRRHGAWNGDVEVLDDDLHPGDRTVRLFRVSESGGSAGGVEFPLASFEGLPGAGGVTNGLELAFAYCLTTHKAQGSEWPSVLVYDEIFGADSECRAWRYTAITRAAERVVIVNSHYRQR